MKKAIFISIAKLPYISHFKKSFKLLANNNIAHAIFYKNTVYKNIRLEKLKNKEQFKNSKALD